MISTHSTSEEETKKQRTMEEFPKHKKLTDRFKKTLYYGYSMPKTDRPSLPLTEIAVELFQDASPKDLGQVDTFLASSMARKACMSPCSMMLGMIYIERLKNKNPEYLQKMSSADLFLLSMMMASKYLYDEGTEDEVFNDEWAESASMEIEDVNKQERNYLSAIDWRLFVHPNEFWNKLDQVETRIAWEKGRERGWLTYTDIYILSRHSGCRNLVLALTALLSKVVIVCSVAYAAAVGTILASTMATVALKERLPVQPITAPVSLWPIMESGSQLAIGDLPEGPEAILQQNESGEELSGTMKTDNMGPPTDGEIKKPQSFGIPGLLTFALLQETVCRFMDGVKLKMNQVYYGVVDRDLGCSKCDKSKICTPTHRSGMKHAPANSTGLLQSMNASELRCNCGRQNKNEHAQEHRWTREQHRKFTRNDGKATKLWNLVATSLSPQVKHGRAGAGQGGRDIYGSVCCCGNGNGVATDIISAGVLTIPISELVLTHGQTLPAISILG